jgi:hypothetical protein
MSIVERLYSLLRQQVLTASRAVLDLGSDRAESVEWDRAADRQSRADQGGRPTGESEGESGGDSVLRGYYANLELPYGAGLEEVQAAWKRQARRYHPDLYAADSERQAIATELLKGINLAHTEICRHLESREH